jgi:hypothetical protein
MPQKKKTILLAIVLLGSIASYAQQGYKITGQIEKASVLDHPGKYIVRVNTLNKNKSSETLGEAAIINGRFQLQGKIEVSCPVLLSILDTTNRVPCSIENVRFFLDGANYHVTFPAKGEPKVSSKNRNEQLAQKIEKYDQSTFDFSLQMSGQYWAAEKAGNPSKIDSLNREFSLLSARNQAAIIKLIQENPDSPVTAHTTLSYLYTLKSVSANANTIIMPGTPNIVIETTINNAKERYALLGDNVKASDIGKELAEYLNTVEKVYTATRNIREDKTAPDFTIQDPEGNLFSLYEIQCKAKIIDFWASWCVPCRKNNPEMVALYEEFQSKGLEIISISLDSDKAKWLEAIEEDGLLWTYHGSELKTGKSDIAQTYNVRLIPTVYLLDANNRIIAVNPQGEELKHKVAELLSK